MLSKSFAVVLALPLAACARTVPHPPYVEQTTAALTAISLPPPPGRIETIPKRPANADAWVDGEWVLRHERWLWLLGRWVHVPEGVRYAPWVTTRASDGTLYYAPSIWVDEHGALVDAPPAIVMATASGEAVFAAGGEVETTGRNITAVPGIRPTEADAGAATHVSDAGAD